MEMSGIYCEIREVIGADATQRLAEYFGGQYVYFPSLASAKRSERDEAIRAAYTGRNIRDLARKHGLSQQRVREIVRDRCQI